MAQFAGLSVNLQLAQLPMRGRFATWRRHCRRHSYIEFGDQSVMPGKPKTYSYTYMHIYSIRFAKPGGPVSGFLCSWFWFLGSRPLICWSPGSRVPWVPGCQGPWFLGFLVTWFSGSLVPVLCRWISLAETMKNKTECWCFFDFVFFV